MAHRDSGIVNFTLNLNNNTQSVQDQAFTAHIDSLSHRADQPNNNNAPGSNNNKKTKGKKQKESDALRAQAFAAFDTVIHS